LANRTKMIYPVDLQNHSVFSDGSFTPQEIIDLAIKRGVKVIAITDHDTVDGISLSLQYAQDKPIIIVPGIEFSCEETAKGYPEVHVLGYFIDHTNPEIISLTDKIKEKRHLQKRLMIEKLRQLGFDISLEEILTTVNSSFGRPHIAKYLIKKYPNRFKDIQDVFDQYIGIGKIAYVPRQDKVYIKEAIQAINKSGGFASLAHPLIYQNSDAEELVKMFVEMGGKALEINYPYHSNTKNTTLEESNEKNKIARELAKKYGLLETGGSDFHGGIRPTQIGDGGISEAQFNKLKKIIP